MRGKYHASQPTWAAAIRLVRFALVATSRRVWAWPAPQKKNEAASVSALCMHVGTSRLRLWVRCQVIRRRGDRTVSYLEQESAQEGRNRVDPPTDRPAAMARTASSAEAFMSAADNRASGEQRQTLEMQGWRQRTPSVRLIDERRGKKGPASAPALTPPASCRRPPVGGSYPRACGGAV
jgi:hypothetical protein